MSRTSLQVLRHAEDKTWSELHHRLHLERKSLQVELQCNMLYCVMARSGSSSGNEMRTLQRYFSMSFALRKSNSTEYSSRLSSGIHCRGRS